MVDIEREIDSKLEKVQCSILVYAGRSFEGEGIKSPLIVDKNMQAQDIEVKDSSRSTFLSYMQEIKFASDQDLTLSTVIGCDGEKYGEPKRLDKSFLKINDIVENCEGIEAIEAKELEVVSTMTDMGEKQSLSCLADVSATELSVEKSNFSDKLGSHVKRSAGITRE